MLTQLNVILKALRPLHWPHFAGGRLRGAFGRALRQASCITLAEDCQGCKLRSSCAYGQVFDPAKANKVLHPSFQDGIPAYVMQPPALGAQDMQPGDERQFSLLLLPPAAAHLSLLQHILREVVEKHLFNPGDCTLHDIEVQAVGVPLQRLVKHQIALQWLSPLRLQNQGQPMTRGQQLDPRTLVQAAWRRQLQYRQLSGQTATAVEPLLQAADQCLLDTRQLQWHAISRYSTRKNLYLPLDGLLGTAILTGPAAALQNLLPLLEMGELLHIGKATVFGLGRFQIRVD